MKAGLLALLLLLSGCVHYVYRPVTLPVADRPVVPAVKVSDFTCPVPLPQPWTMCITDSTYTKLKERETGYKNWGLENEAILNENNAKAGGH